MKLLIALHHRNPAWIPPPWFAERLRQEFSLLQVVQLHGYYRLKEEIADADLAIGWSFRGDQVAAAKRLRWIHSTAAAVHALLSPELLAGDIVVTSARAVHGPVVAEHALALMFALAKRLPQCMRAQMENHWAQIEMFTGGGRPRELRDAKLLIIGMGAIGSTLAALARGIGMQVEAVRRRAQVSDPLLERSYGFEQIEIALPTADFVVLAVPVLPETHHLMNAHRLSLLKPSAYLVNVGRGMLIDEVALITALQHGSFAGAALDVTTEEPLPRESPLWSMDNLLITPHIAGYADKMWERHYELYSENLRRYLGGEPLLWTVDKHVGY